MANTHFSNSKCFNTGIESWMDTETFQNGGEEK
jgi:hypothetical protein